MLARTTICCLALGVLLPALAHADIANRTRLGKSDLSVRAQIAAKLTALPAAQTGCPKGATFVGAWITGCKSMHAAPDHSVESIEFKAVPVKTLKIFGKSFSVPTLGGCTGTCSIETGFAGLPQWTSFQVTGKPHLFGRGIPAAQTNKVPKVHTSKNAAELRDIAQQTFPVVLSADQARLLQNPTVNAAGSKQGSVKMTYTLSDPATAASLAKALNSGWDCLYENINEGLNRVGMMDLKISAAGNKVTITMPFKVGG